MTQMQSEQIGDIATALAKAQGAIEGAVKGKENPHFRSKYADLGAVWEACREHLTKNGIAVVQRTAKYPDNGGLVTITTLIHSSGQWIEDGGIPLLLSKQDMQGLGSALTYSRRYGLMAMVGIAPEDDDGNAASAKTNGQTQQQTQPVVPEKPEGYAAWRKHLNETAMLGRAELNARWSNSLAEFRDYLRKTEPTAIDDLRALAAKADARPKATV